MSLDLDVACLLAVIRDKDRELQEWQRRAWLMADLYADKIEGPAGSPSERSSDRRAA
jgi:hypothetical protein